MKKSLLALAALSAFATAAQAQSSVTIYGIVDVNWSSVDNDAGQNFGTLVNSQMASSRLGFKGSEDLGGGLKANFVLESALATSNGQLGTTGTNNSSDVTSAAVTFNRAAWVGLSGGFGEIRLGKQDVTAANDIDPIVSQMGNMGNFGTNTALATTIGDNKDNAVVYISPSISGFQLQAGYATNNTATAEVTTGDTVSYMVSYAQGPLKLFAAQQEQKGNVSATDDLEETILGASYDAGFASFGIAYQDGEKGTASGKQTNYTVAVPVKALGSGVKLHAGYLINENETTANSDITTTKLAITKALSKRTTVYGAYQSADNDSAVSSVGGKTVVTTTVGVVHTF